MTESIQPMAGPPPTAAHIEYMRQVESVAACLTAAYVQTDAWGTIPIKDVVQKYKELVAYMQAAKVIFDPEAVATSLPAASPNSAPA